MRSLVEFIQEQDLINYRRLSGEQWPWTDDPVMAYYKFGNVRREFDRTNRFLFNLFNKRECTPGLLANCLVHRLISCYDFTARHGLFGDFESFKSAYNRDRAAGLQVRPTSFTSCMSDSALLKSAELAFILAVILTATVINSQSLEACFYNFKKVVGKFTAWQAALDCMMHGWVTNSTDFVHLGPGAESTLALLDMDAFDYPTLVCQVNQHIQYLTLRFEEVEGLLCEYGRYIKYNTKWPGRYRRFDPDSRPFIPIPLDKVFNEAMSTMHAKKV